MSEHRVRIGRDPGLAAESIEQVARRYHAASPTGSTLTLAIVVIGLAIVGVAGAFAWSAEVLRGLVVLLGGAFIVGLFAGLAPPPVAGIRAIVVAAVAIATVPVVLLAIGAVFVSGPDRDWALGALAVTAVGGSAMVALTVSGYALVRRLRVPADDRGTSDPIAAAVLAMVRADLDRAGKPAGDRELVCSVADDPGGRAWLELETRLLTRAGYRETSRERVTVGASAGVALLDIALGLGDAVPGSSARVTIEAAFAPPTAEPVSAATGPDPELAAAVARWRGIRRSPAGPRPRVGEVLDGAGSGIAALVAVGIVCAVLAAQVVAMVLLWGIRDDEALHGTPPDPLQVAVSVALIAALPFATGWVAGWTRGLRGWWAAVVPLFGALAFTLATGGPWTGEKVVAMAGLGAALSAPWALGWLLALGVRRLRRGPVPAGPR